MQQSPHFIPFRRKLILFAVTIALVVGIPALFFALQQPWRELGNAIKISKGIIGSVQPAIQKEHLNIMNAFTLEQITSVREITGPERQYLDWAFNLYVLEPRLPTQTELEMELSEQQEYVTRSLDYTALQKAYEYWDYAFHQHPEALEVFRTNKRYLQQTSQSTEATETEIADIYIMLDSGKRDGFFQNNIAFVLDGYPWYLSSFPGDTYSPPPGSHMRRNASEGIEGYDHNEITSPSRFFLPAFYTDTWGKWFSVWLTEKNRDGFNLFIIDFNAEQVLQMMQGVAMAVLAISLLTSAAAGVLIHWLSRRYSRSPVELTKGIRKVAQGDYTYEVPELYDEFDRVRTEFNRMTTKLQERDRLQLVLEKFLSKELAERAAKEGLMVGGEEAHCTMMFTDFAGFSTITGDMNPTDIVTALNEYFATLIPIIKKHGGFPDKFIGDAIVAIFGAPLHMKDHAQRAVLCAKELQETMRKMNDERRQKGQLVFEMRIGLNTGEVLVGAIGCDMKLEYTSIGESTNLAQRMESHCPIGQVLMSDNTYKEIPPKFWQQHAIETEKETFTVKGYKREVIAYIMQVSPVDIKKRADAEAPEEYYEYTARSSGK